MRLLLLSLIVALLACACASRASTPGQSPAIPEPAAGPLPGLALTGSFGGRPFIARSALLIRQTEWQDGRVTTVIAVFERPIGCAEAQSLLLGAIPGERAIEIRFGVRWPVFPSSVWVARIGESEWTTADSVVLQFVQYGASKVGSLAEGRVEVQAASAAGGTLSLEMARAPDAVARGNVQFAVCPPGNALN